MRIAIGVVFITIMGCVFTLMTAVIFVSQHLFASAVLAGVIAASVVSIARRRKARRLQAGTAYPIAAAGPQPIPVRGAAQMSSAAVSPRRRMQSLPARSMS